MLVTFFTKSPHLEKNLIFQCHNMKAGLLCFFVCALAMISQGFFTCSFHHLIKFLFLFVKTFSYNIQARHNQRIGASWSAGPEAAWRPVLYSGPLLPAYSLHTPSSVYGVLQAPVYSSVSRFAGLQRKGPANRWPDDATEEAKPRNPRINLKFVRRLRSAFQRREF